MKTLPAVPNFADTLSTMKTVDGKIRTFAQQAREQKERRRVRLRVVAYNYGISWERLQVAKYGKAPVSVPVKKPPLVERAVLWMAKAATKLGESNAQ